MKKLKHFIFEHQKFIQNWRQKWSGNKINATRYKQFIYKCLKFSKIIVLVIFCIGNIVENFVDDSIFCFRQFEVQINERCHGRNHKKYQKNKGSDDIEEWLDGKSCDDDKDLVYGHRYCLKH